MPRIKHDRGGVTVLFTRDEIKAFRRSWPSSGLPVDSMNISFSPNGDVRKIVPREKNVSDPEAIAALVHDARKFAKLPPWGDRPGRVPGLDGVGDARHAAWLGESGIGQFYRMPDVQEYLMNPGEDVDAFLLCLRRELQRRGFRDLKVIINERGNVVVRSTRRTGARNYTDSVIAEIEKKCGL